MYESLAHDHRGDARYPYKLAMALNDLSNQQDYLGLADKSLRTAERSLELRRRVAGENPGVPEYQKELGIGLANYGIAIGKLGRLDEELTLYEEARAVYERLIRDHPGVADYRFRVATVFRAIGTAEETRERIDLAFRAAGKARDLLEGVVRDHPDDLRFRYDLAYTVRWIGQIYHRRTNRHAEAIPYFRRAIELFENLVRENPEVRTYPLELAYSSCYLGQVLHEAGQEPEASDISRKAVALFERVDTEGMASLYDLACIRSLSSELVRASGPEHAARDRSRRLADRAMEALRQAVDGGYRDLAWIEHDIDLDPLRSRDDYKALVAKLKAHGAASKNDKRG